jgi:hypothetical protein
VTKGSKKGAQRRTSPHTPPPGPCRTGTPPDAAANAANAAAANAAAANAANAAAAANANAAAAAATAAAAAAAAVDRAIIAGSRRAACPQGAPNPPLRLPPHPSPGK